MQPNVHALFPVGAAGGPTRSVPEAARRTVREGTPVDLGVRNCPGCGRATVWPRCSCGTHTDPTDQVVTESFPVARIWNDALARLHLGKVPMVKGVKGLASPGKCPEPIEKGILRASHGISVYQDGTARFNLTDLPLTHFRPREIGTSVQRIRELGYTTGWSGWSSRTPTSWSSSSRRTSSSRVRAGSTWSISRSSWTTSSCGCYNLEPFYRAERPDDLVGHIVVALAPHTSGGVAGRILGFTNAEACFAHPILHSAKRRNCDGDEDSVTLLLDALVNFSRAYLPASRGALMDKPLVLTTRLDPTEVDKEAHNVDVGADPLALYRAATERRIPKDVEALVETVGHRLGTAGALSGYGFTHDTRDVTAGPVRSAYRGQKGMRDTVERSIVLTSQIRAVNVAEAVTLVLNGHFLRDVMGNLKSYATQRFRCKNCGTSYRRPPLDGRCTAPRPGGRATASSRRPSTKRPCASTSRSPSTSPRSTGSPPTCASGSNSSSTRSRRSSRRRASRRPSTSSRPRARTDRGLPPNLDRSRRGTNK